MRRHSLGASSRVVTHEIVLSETTLRISANYTVQTKQQHTREADSSFDDLGWDFSTALPHATAPKKSAEEQVQELVGSLASFAYLDLPPYQRLTNKTITLFLDVGHGTISFPRYSDLRREAALRTLLSGKKST